MTAHDSWPIVTSHKVSHNDCQHIFLYVFTGTSTSFPTSLKSKPTFFLLTKCWHNHKLYPRETKTDDFLIFLKQTRIAQGQDQIQEILQGFHYKVCGILSMDPFYPLSPKISLNFTSINPVLFLWNFKSYMGFINFPWNILNKIHMNMFPHVKLCFHTFDNLSYPYHVQLMPRWVFFMIFYLMITLSSLWSVAIVYAGGWCVR